MPCRERRGRCWRGARERCCNDNARPVERSRAAMATTVIPRGVARHARGVCRCCVTYCRAGRGATALRQRGPAPSEKADREVRFGLFRSLFAGQKRSLRSSGFPSASGRHTSTSPCSSGLCSPLLIPRLDGRGQRQGICFPPRARVSGLGRLPNSLISPKISSRAINVALIPARHCECVAVGRCSGRMTRWRWARRITPRAAPCRRKRSQGPAEGLTSGRNTRDSTRAARLGLCNCQLTNVRPYVVNWKSGSGAARICCMLTTVFDLPSQLHNSPPVFRASAAAYNDTASFLRRLRFVFADRRAQCDGGA